MRVDPSLYNRYADEIDALAAMPGNTVTNDAFLAKYDEHGSLDWIRQYDYGSYEFESYVAADTLENLYLAATTGAISRDAFFYLA